MGLSQKLICEANAEHAALVAVAGIVKPLAMALRSSGRDEDGNLSEEDESLIRSALGSLANLAAVRNGGGK